MSKTEKRAGAAPLPPAEGRSGLPLSADTSNVPAVQPSCDVEVAEFLKQIKALGPHTGTGRGRLVFAMDATMSRRPTWDLALSLQCEMFGAVKQVGGLDVQLIYFRGMGECRSSKWVSDPEALSRLMTPSNARRHDSDRQGVVACASGDRAAQDPRPRLCRRLHGGERRCSSRQGRRAIAARRAGVSLSRGARYPGRAGIPRYCSSDPGRLSAGSMPARRRNCAIC